MTVVVFDSSALVKLVVSEPGSEQAIDLFLGCDAAVASQLAHPEVCAAIAAASRAHRLTPADAETALHTWLTLWPSVRTVDLGAAVTEQAGTLAHRHSVRGADDTVHVATYLALGSRDVVFASWDHRQREAAARVGARLAPVSLE